MSQEMKKQIISGVGLLDIRRATTETLSRVHRIEGVGTVVCSPETRPFLTQISVSGVGSVIEAPLDAKLLTGKTTLNKDLFRGEHEPLNMVIVGQVTVEADLTVEDVEKGLGALYLVGQMVCPQHLSGVLQTKMQELTGHVHYYSHQKPHIVVGNLNLDAHYLEGLDDHSEILVIGKLDMLDVLPNDVLEQKVGKFGVIGKVTLREENASVYYAKSDKTNSNSKVTTIPEGFEWIQREMTLDATQVEALSARNLYCTNTVRIENDVTAELFDEALDQFKCTGLVFCPASLKSVMGKKCDLLNTRVTFYTDTLWVVEDRTELIPSRFDYLDGQVTLVVMDTLKIHPDVAGKVLFEKFDKVHNLGKIICNEEQMGAIQARLGTDDGDLTLPKEKKEKPESKEADLYERIEGVGTLRL